MSFYHKWVEEVKAHVPPERLLIFEAKDGWAPLCKFLNVPEPDEPYPRTNDTQQMLDMIKVKRKTVNNENFHSKLSKDIFPSLLQSAKRVVFIGQYVIPAVLAGAAGYFFYAAAS